MCAFIVAFFVLVVPGAIALYGAGAGQDLAWARFYFLGIMAAWIVDGCLTLYED